MNIQFPRKMLQAYSAYCKELCQQAQVPQTAFDILLFLANNPALRTARDIVEVRGIKANLVSVHVDRLVREGYLERRADPDDRRKTQLLCTEKAQPVIDWGRDIQAAFFDRLFQGVGEEDRRAFQYVLAALEENLNQMAKGVPE